MAGNLHSSSGIQPPRLENCKTFTTFKKAIDLWRQVSGIPAEQQGIVVALSLPATSIFGDNLGNKAIENIPSSKLNSSQGLDLVLAFLDKEVLSDSSSELIKRWNNFFYLTRDEGQTVDEYIEKFETAVEHLKEAGQELADQIKGVELMRKLGLKSNERKIVQELVDFNKNKDKVYEAMKEQTKQFLQKSTIRNSTKAKNDEASVGADFVKVASPSSLFPVPGIKVGHGGYSVPPPAPPPPQNRGFGPFLLKSTSQSYAVPSNQQFRGHAHQGGRGRNGAPHNQRANQNNGPSVNNNKNNSNSNNNNNTNPNGGGRGGKKTRGKSIPPPVQRSVGGGSKDKAAAGGSDQTQTIIVHVNAVSK